MIYYSLGVTTTIAYGDITPKNPLTVLYNTVAFIFTTLIFGYYLSEMLRILVRGYMLQGRKNNDQFHLDLMMKKYKTHPALNERIEEFINGQNQR